MSTTAWKGTIDGDLTNAGNWTGIVPIANDTALWDGSSSVAVDTNAAALTALTFDEVNIGRAYAANLGDSGTPLEFSAVRFLFNGTGKLFFNNGSTGTTADLWVETPSGSVVLGDNSSGGGITRITLLACQDAVLASTLDSTNDLFVGSGVNATIQGSNTIANVYVAPGATVTSTAAITNLHMFGGTWNQRLGGAAIASMYLSPNAVMNYWATAAITLAVVAPTATLNLNNGPQPKTLTTGWFFPNSRVARIDETLGTFLRPVQNSG